LPLPRGRRPENGQQAPPAETAGDEPDAQRCVAYHRESSMRLNALTRERRSAHRQWWRMPADGLADHARKPCFALDCAGKGFRLTACHSTMRQHGFWLCGKKPTVLAPRTLWDCHLLTLSHGGLSPR